MSKNDGGPAAADIRTDFDYHYESQQRFPNTYSSGGMSMRDWFAGMALQGAMANERLLPSTQDELNHLAMRVYEMADAMLLERDKP